ncbi:hypothetical protein [uncultured Ramlibacter sp.]|uniref:hypothetical protein n=1 Tax=uncultured Ramlibacter sp. TaxID=260755 RepID=UPI00260FA2F0|nr:hypothetical protein [uncultured Ramlibacter sp.]
MTHASTRAVRPLGAINEQVSSDFDALASHMQACYLSQGRFFQLRSSLESLHALVSPRLISTAALFTVIGLGLLAIA